MLEKEFSDVLRVEFRKSSKKPGEDSESPGNRLDGKY